MFELLHIAQPLEYRGSSDSYVPPSYTSEGFVHCCRPTQLSGVLERWFSSAEELLLLTLDGEFYGEALKAEIGPGGQLFPHVYAPIAKASVLAVTPICRGADGLWQLPQFLPGRPIPTGEQLARAFHTTYGNLANQYGLQLMSGHSGFEKLPTSMQELLIATMTELRRDILGWG